MFRFPGFHNGIRPAGHLRPPAQLLVPLVLLAGCNGQWFNIGAPPTATLPQSTVTPIQATVTQTPMDAPGETTILQTATTEPAPDGTGTPVDAPSATLSLGTATSGPTPVGTGTPWDDTPTSTPTPTWPPNHIVNGNGSSRVEHALPLLESQVGPVILIIVSNQSAGVEGDIYRDLHRRLFRTTTGPDEGIDTKSEFCYPTCIFVLSEEVNAIGVSAWVRVLQHEYRHVTQAKHNSTLAQDFRDVSGAFTPYGAFSEACADYGLGVAPVYRAQQRIDQLKRVLGPDQQGLIDGACAGDKSAYGDMVTQYDQKVGQPNAFQGLFPPYR